MEALAHLRHLIASLDEALVDALCTRAPLGFNPLFYAMPANPFPGLDVVAGEFADDTIYMRCLSEEYGCGLVSMNVYSEGSWWEPQYFDF